MTNEPKRPIQGQWYECDLGRRMYCCGVDSTGRPIFDMGPSNEASHTRYGYCEPQFFRRLKHLPTCDGFEWVPTVFPQWWIPRCESFCHPDNGSKPIAYYRRDTPDDGFTFCTDGSSFAFGRWTEDDCRLGDEAEALARLIPPVPAESPEDWVEIDKAIYPRHVPRRSVDVLLLDDTDISKAGSASPVFEINLAQISAATWDGWKFACRRADLPPQPSPDPTVVWSEMRAPEGRTNQRLWINRSTGVIHASDIQIHTTDKELFYDRNGFHTKPSPSAKHTSRSIDSSGVDERRP